MNQNDNLNQPISQQSQSLQNIQQTTMPEPQNEYFKEPKKDRKKNYIISIVVLAVILIVGIFLIKPLFNNNSSQNGGKFTGKFIYSSNDFSEKKYNGNKEKYVIATVGHEGHGKSTLVSAITKLYGNYTTTDDINKTIATTKNGMNFNYFFTEYETNDKHYYLYDMPKNSDYLKATISSAIELDGAILVVSAVEGPMSETREQINLLHELGITNLVVYISKCDLTDDRELIYLVESELRALLDEYGFDGTNTPFVKGSASLALEGNQKEIKKIQELTDDIDKWITKNNMEKSKSNTNKFKASMYLMNESDEGNNQTLKSNDNIDIVFKDFTSQATIQPSRETISPGNYDIVNMTLNNSNSLKNGDVFQLYKNQKFVGIGIITSTLD